MELVLRTASAYRNGSISNSVMQSDGPFHPRNHRYNGYGYTVRHILCRNGYYANEQHGESRKVFNVVLRNTNSIAYHRSVGLWSSIVQVAGLT